MTEEKPLSEKRAYLKAYLKGLGILDVDINNILLVIQREDAEHVKKLKDGCIICGKKVVFGIGQRGRPNRSSLCNTCMDRARHNINKLRELYFKKIDKIMGSFNHSPQKDVRNAEAGDTHVQLKKTKENFNKNKDVKGEYNHSPPVKLVTSPQGKKSEKKSLPFLNNPEDTHSSHKNAIGSVKGEIPTDEDTQDICECGHEEKQHNDGWEYSTNNPNTYCLIKGCSCKEFKPVKPGLIEKEKKGCGGSTNYSNLKCGELDQFEKPVYCDECFKRIMWGQEKEVGK